MNIYFLYGPNKIAGILNLNIFFSILLTVGRSAVLGGRFSNIAKTCAVMAVTPSRKRWLKWQYPQI
jgi:hypothetical protein